MKLGDATLLAILAAAPPAAAQPLVTLDLAAVSPEDGVVRRVYGATGTGQFGVPVAGGHDVDGDGRTDYAVAYFTADPPGRGNAGEVDLIFGDGTLGGFLDTAADSPALLRVFGAVAQETAGAEIWIDDVTGDGLGDLLIGRQNFLGPAARIGAGALTVMAGSPALRGLADDSRTVDLASPPGELTLATFVGAGELDRLGVWMRTGDVDGDGVADIVVGADQEDLEGEENRGAVYVIRGGGHLAHTQTIDLRDFGATALAGHIAKITPPSPAAGFHFGATCQIADLDGNGRGEVLVAAALLRAGASVPAAGAPPGAAESVGGSPEGTLYIAWDDNFPSAAWPPGFSFDAGAPPGSRTVIDGGELNLKLGEEILGGEDYDGDGRADLFVGDLVGAAPFTELRRPGVGYVFYDAAALKGRVVDLGSLPAELRLTTIAGPSANAIGADTAAHGDFDGDGFADLAFCSPHGSPAGRFHAGIAHVLYGRDGGWPAAVDTAAGNLPPPPAVRVAELWGAAGAGSDRGDTLGYSAAAGDVDGDGRSDLVINEMLGNALDGSADVGNLLLVDGAALAGGCRAGVDSLCLNGRRFAVDVKWRDFAGNTGSGRVAPPVSADSGLFWFFSRDNWELLVKVLDGCAVNGHQWVFAAAPTNVEYTLRVTDSLTGEVREYFNPLGRSAEAVTDTQAFAGCF